MMNNTLYDRDLQLWIEQTVQQLKNREFGSLDIEHLIEELVDLVRGADTSRERVSDQLSFFNRTNSR